MPATRCMLSSFDMYLKAKHCFLQSLFEYSSRKENIDQLIQLDVLGQLALLLRDVSSVQHLAMMALTRLCNNSDLIACNVLERKIISEIGKDFDTTSKEYKRNAVSIVKAVSKYPQLTETLMCQAEDILKPSLHEHDPALKEITLNTLTNVAIKSPDMAKYVIGLNILPALTLCLQQTVSHAQEATRLLKVLCKQSMEFSSVVMKNLLQHIINNLHGNDSKLTRQTLLCLAEISKHKLEFAQKLVNTKSILCKAILHTAHSDINVMQSAAILLRELSKHNATLCASIVQHGGIPAFITMVGCTTGTTRMPAVMTLGYIAAQSDHLALAIIQSQGLDQLVKTLHEEINETCQSTVVWAIEKITHHSTQHASYLHHTNVFAKVLKIYLTHKCPEIKQCCLTALTNTLTKCMHVSDIEPLLYESPPEILLLVLKQLAKIFSVDPRARRLFVSTGGLKKVQLLKAGSGSELSEAITIINSFFPEDIVRYYSPHYPQELLAQIEKYTPILPANMICSDNKSDKFAASVATIRPE